MFCCIVCFCCLRFVFVFVSVACFGCLFFVFYLLTAKIAQQRLHHTYCKKHCLGSTCRYQHILQYVLYKSSSCLHRTAIDRTATDRKATDHDATDRTAPDRKATDRKATGLGGWQAGFSGWQAGHGGFLAVTGLGGWRAGFGGWAVSWQNPSHTVLSSF